jgi:hypothetical protein
MLGIKAAPFRAVPRRWCGAVVGADRLGLYSQVVDQGSVGLLERLLDKSGHEYITPHVDIFTNVETGPRRIEPQLDGLLRLSRERTADGPLVADIKTHRGIAMGLQAVGEVMECTGVGDLAGHDAAGQVGDLIGERVPGAIALVGRRMVWRNDGMALLDERVQVNHLDMVVEERDGRLSRNARR